MDDIRVIKNIFTEDERLEILKSIKPFLVDAEWLSLSCFGVPDKIPGKQSYPTLQHSPDFKWIYDRFDEIIKEKLNLDLDLYSSWVNWTDGRMEHINWHSHDKDYASVYYIQVPRFINGTLFKNKFYRSPQNSMILFPGHLEHTAPISPFRWISKYERYTMAMDYNIRKES